MRRSRAAGFHGDVGFRVLPLCSDLRLILKRETSMVGMVGSGVSHACLFTWLIYTGCENFIFCG